MLDKSFGVHRGKQLQRDLARVKGGDGSTGASLSVRDSSRGAPLEAGKGGSEARLEGQNGCTWRGLEGLDGVAESMLNR